MTGPSSLMTKEEEEEDEGNDSSDSDRKSKMNFSYWGADNVTIHKPVVKPRHTSNRSRKGALSLLGYGSESQWTPNSGLVSSIHISATHILDLRAAVRRQLQHLSSHHFAKLYVKMETKLTRTPELRKSITNNLTNRQEEKNIGWVPIKSKPHCVQW